MTLEVIENIVNSCRAICPICFDNRMDIVCIEHDSSKIILSFMDFSDPNLKSTYLESKYLGTNLKKEESENKKLEPVIENPYEFGKITLKVIASCINTLGVLKCNLIKTTSSEINKLDDIPNYINYENSFLIINVIDLNKNDSLYYHYKCSIKDNKQAMNLIKLDYIFADTRNSKPSVWNIGDNELIMQICDSIEYTK